MRTLTAIAALLLPGGAPIKPGARLIQAEYAETLALIAREGPGTAHFADGFLVLFDGAAHGVSLFDGGSFSTLVGSLPDRL